MEARPGRTKLGPSVLGNLLRDLDARSGNASFAKSSGSDHWVFWEIKQIQVLGMMAAS